MFDATDLHHQAVLVELGAAALTFASLMVVVAPYGRHTRAGWGPTLSARAGWTIMETPAVLGMAAIFATGKHRSELVPLVMLALWLFHYVRRAWIYPLRMTADNKRIPAVVVFLAVVFNLLNAFVNGGWIADRGEYASSWLFDGRFIAGAGLFVIGLHVNARADAILAHLRAPGDVRYHVPRGWLYEYVSCPNYLGEILEWFGWALLTWSLAGLAFALYTTANLLPRALSHHRWYRAQFPDYPPRRKAVLPGLL